jgi:hypothetical protein
MRDSFQSGESLDGIADPRLGMSTNDNGRFLREWHEISINEIKFSSASAEEAINSHLKWVPYNKGGSFRRWYGNQEYVINYENDGYEVKGYAAELYGSYTRTVKNIPYFFKPGLTWSLVGSGTFSLRVLPVGFDWDAYETSKVGLHQPAASECPDYRQPTLKATYQKLRAHWREMTLEMQRLEEENNRIFIDAYGLQDELTPEVPLNEITLTCNPHYRYGNDKSEDELEALLLADTMRELVSYAVGCMFGRYALDKPGLILANQGETIEDYLKRVPEPSFPADDDNVIPMLDGDWFTDDIAERFRKFLRVAFGDEHYEENLKFVEKALGINGKRPRHTRLLPQASSTPTM